MRFSRRTAVAVIGAVALLAPAACGSGGGGGGSSSKNVEVFTWWADGGEKAGLDGLVSVFDTACSGYKFVNGAVAGGAGSNAKQVLASRLQQSEPPDTFQAHAGAELSDYINAGQVEDLSSEYQEWGLNIGIPEGPPGQHHGRRQDLLGAGEHPPCQRRLVQQEGPERRRHHQGPDHHGRVHADLDTLKAKGVATPLALGKDWTQEMLFEAVLISDLGADAFTGLWSGKTDWKSAPVTAGINDYKKLLSYTNKDRDTFDWTDAEKLIMDGKAGFQLMGDWEAADLDAKGFKDYGYFVFPGNGTAYQWLADSFVLPKGAKDPDGTKCWLKTVGSADGQKAFNTKKGSIPARTDANPSDYPTYQQAAMADWKADTAVPSCPHGSACSQGWQGAVELGTGQVLHRWQRGGAPERAGRGGPAVRTEELTA